MNLALDRYAENPIIDELVAWPPRARRIRRVRASNPMFRRPFVEVDLEDGSQFHRHFQRESFVEHWAEAVVILQALTGIEVVADFRFVPRPDAAALEKEIIEARDECLAEAAQMYREGMYMQYLMQFGVDYKNLPEETENMLADARARLSPGA